MRALLLASLALALGCSADPAATTGPGDDASATEGSAGDAAAELGQLDATTETHGTGGAAVMGSGGAGGALGSDAGPVGGAGAADAQVGSGGAGGGPGTGGAGGAAPTLPACSDPEAARIGSTNCVRRQPDPDGFFSSSRKGGLTCALCTSYQANGLPLHYVRGCALGGTYCVASSCNECD